VYFLINILSFDYIYNKRQIMATFKKKDIMELVGGDIYSDGGDKNTNGDSEIETGPVHKSYDDNSDYQKGQSTTTDKVTSRYRQDIPWFATYSYGGRRSLGGLQVYETNTRVLTKNAVEEKIEDLVKKSKPTDINPKDYNPKLANILDEINDTDLTEKQLEELKKAIEDKVMKKLKNL
jgi:hypothetical protein